MSNRKDIEYTADSLDNVMIAAPCNIGWDNMVGDDRVRLCAGCDKNVYNTSRMTKAEIKELLAVEGKGPMPAHIPQSRWHNAYRRLPSGAAPRARRLAACGKSSGINMGMCIDCN
ncbi:MAG: hypothetical protein IPO31_10410 [Candidatus Obscuribacter sp.]|nr:hypothetical protein [Candidatus Obscuribacter sp.]